MVCRIICWLLFIHAIFLSDIFTRLAKNTGMAILMRSV